MIENSINEIRYDFERETGKQATKLYLGWETYRDLVRSFRDLMTYATNNPPMRTQYMGMDVYRVDEKQYISVGI